MATINDALMDLLMNKNDDADATFLVHGEEVKGHRFIICARSEGLKAMLNFGEQPADGRYPINDPEVSTDVFKEFLKFFYLDQCDVNFGNLGALIHMSEMYFVPKLKEFCTSFAISQCSSIDGILRTGEIAVRYSNEAPELLRCVFEGLGKVAFPAFSYMTDVNTTLPSRMLLERIVANCPRTDSLTEDGLLLKIYKWCKAMCHFETGKVEANRMKTKMSWFIGMMNLKKLSDKVLIDVIHKKSLLPRDQYYQILVDRLALRTRKENSLDLGSDEEGEDIIYL